MLQQVRQAMFHLMQSVLATPFRYPLLAVSLATVPTGIGMKDHAQVRQEVQVLLLLSRRLLQVRILIM